MFFITGLEQDLFPLKNMDEVVSVEKDEEERRLFYVALTRAKEKVFLTYSHQRTIFGSSKMNVGSEFLSDISEDIIEVKEDAGESIITIE